MCRDVSLVTTQLGYVSLGLHDCTHEERREFIHGRGFTASVVTDSFPGLREHRVVLGNSVDEVLVRLGGEAFHHRPWTISLQQETERNSWAL